jgi:hypothetical protein
MDIALGFGSTQNSLVQSAGWTRDVLTSNLVVRKVASSYIAGLQRLGKLAPHKYFLLLQDHYDLIGLILASVSLPFLKFIDDSSTGLCENFKYPMCHPIGL